MESDLAIILREIRELREIVKVEARSNDEAEAHAKGLLSYEDLQDRLTVGRRSPRRPSLRWVKGTVAKYRAVIRPVELGSRSVGFTDAGVERLIARLSGEKAGGRLL